MKPGDVLERSIWLDGTENAEILARWAAESKEAFEKAGEQNGFIIGQPVAVIKYPGDDRVPPVPDHISGPDVRLMVAEAEVLQYAPYWQANRSSLFAADIGPDDLKALRKITRDGYAKMFPHMPRLSDRQCDTLINNLGPEAAAEALSRNQADIKPLLN